MIFLILVTCKNKATPASFLRQKIHSPSRFSLLFLSSLEQELAKLGEHVTFWFALTPPSLKWLTEQKNPKSLLRSILEFSCLYRRLLSVPYQFLRPFLNFPKPLFQSETNCEAIGMTMIARILILIQTKLIIARKVLHLASFRKWGLNSELAYSMVLPWWYLLTRSNQCLHFCCKQLERPS